MQSPETEAKLTRIRTLESKTVRLDYRKQEASLRLFTYTLLTYMKESMLLTINTDKYRY